ncbi:MAG: ADP-ribosylglycohydrolase family protein [Armatimonadetes bacterium]|nr:ADP-ribosylglycohydrolase family protein [Armatimonadota bacterium]
MNDQHSKIAGGFYGLLVGDALGVPYEFKPADEIPPRAQIEFAPPSGYPRTYAHVPSGTWSDDGAQALALLDSLLTRGKLDLEDLAQRLVNWQIDGFYAVGGKVFDIGITTSAAIGNYRAGQKAEDAGLRDVNSNGNGSLMRVLPLVLWHRGTDGELVRDAMAQSLVTHGHARSQVCCALYCLWARRLLENDPAAWENATAILRDVIVFLPDGEAFEEELEFQIRPDDFAAGHGSGYVVDALRSALWVMREEGYENVVKAAVALGSDTDTTACIAGGVAGIRDGLEAIPARWRENLRGQEIASPLLERLLDRI